jgi:hypothetical protein
MTTLQYFNPTNNAQTATPPQTENPPTNALDVFG